MAQCWMTYFRLLRALRWRSWYSLPLEISKIKKKNMISLVRSTTDSNRHINITTVYKNFFFSKVFHAPALYQAMHGYRECTILFV